MSGIIPFDFETNPVRVAMIDDAPWFVAVDVCRVLELANPRQAVDRLDHDEVQTVNLNTVHSNDGIQKGVHTADTLRGNPNMNLVSESGLYALIFTSRKPAAKRFRKWVTSEVLPTLRREGAYAMPEAEDALRDSDYITIDKDDYITLLVDQNALLKLMKAAVKTPRKPAVPLTSAEKAKIISLATQGLSNGEIARQTGRSTATISLLRNGFRIINGGDA